jgi:hypothetical protein
MDYPINSAAASTALLNGWYNVVADSINGVTETADDMGLTFANPGLLASDPLPDADEATPIFTNAAVAQNIANMQLENPSAAVGTSYLDIGAVQHADPAGGGGVMNHPGMTGGCNG